ncbi:hypothetical protein RIF29_21146 [Crotalaria pallida]|uniref:Uncharacterized protein n=1 Tax=Crotalaria pallida TaxID=3830 RepID=A0AAN9I5P5_CROPI
MDGGLWMEGFKGGVLGVLAWLGGSVLVGFGGLRGWGCEGEGRRGAVGGWVGVEREDKSNKIALPLKDSNLSDASFGTSIIKLTLAWIEKLDDLRSKIKERVALDDHTVLSPGKDGNINSSIDIVKDLEAPEPDQNQTKNKDSADLINGSPKQTFEKAPSLNRDHFSNIDNKEEDLRNSLNIVQQELTCRLDDLILQQAEKDLVNQYNGVRTAAELFLRQKAKLLWLKDGDANTKIFHQSIKKRLYHNRVLNITKADGSAISDPILIHKEFQ